MDLICYPKKLSGEIKAISSKSHAHRILICAALASSPTEVFLSPELSEDIKATIGCLKALGAKFETGEGVIRVTPLDQKNLPQNPLLDCKESGATLRFVLPLVAALGCGGRFAGSGKLPQRPLGPLLDALKDGGVKADHTKLPLTIKGKLSKNIYTLPGNISSQFITGFLFALALLDGGKILLSTPLESAKYVDMTRDVLGAFGIQTEVSDNIFTLPPSQTITSPHQIQVEGDWSNMAFFLTAGALGGPLSCQGLSDKSTQGDRYIFELLKDFGARVCQDQDVFTVQKSEEQDAFQEDSQTLEKAPRPHREIDVREIPDLVPILSVIASVSPGTTRISGASRLRIKESDRLKTVSHMIESLGGKITEGEDYLVIEGVLALSGGTVDCANDHRIAMAGAIASCASQGPVILKGADAVNKSYPGFFKDFKKTGGLFHVINNR